MTAFKRLGQALPQSYLTARVLSCRTKIFAIAEPVALTRLGYAVVSQTPATVQDFRSFSTSRAALKPDGGYSKQDTMSNEIKFSAKQPDDLPERASKLLPTWELCASKKGVMRQFTFSSFANAWKFMSIVADECKRKNHHPTWTNTYNKVIIEWTTHKPEGLSIKDIEMAEFCDRIAKEI